MLTLFVQFQSTIENLHLVLEANKKEDNAVDALRVELDRKSKDKSEMVKLSRTNENSKKSRPIQT